MTRVASREIPSTISGFISAVWRACAFNSLLAYAWRQSHYRFSPASPWNLQPSLSTRPAHDQNMVDHQEHEGGLLLLALLSCVAGRPQVLWSPCSALRFRMPITGATPGSRARMFMGWLALCSL